MAIIAELSSNQSLSPLASEDADASSRIAAPRTYPPISAWFDSTRTLIMVRAPHRIDLLVELASELPRGCVRYIADYGVLVVNATATSHWATVRAKAITLLHRYDPTLTIDERSVVADFAEGDR